MGLVSAWVSVSKARIRAWSIGAALAALAGGWIVGLTGASSAGASPTAASSTLSLSTCHLAAPYKHVIYIQFDNQHLSRDNPNVPSDIEQVPALKNFLSGNGALLSDEHTPLISHTADDIVTSLTGLYPDRQGLAVANSYAQYAPNSGKVPTTFPSAFTYWTDPVSSTDPLPNLITDGQKNTPAPWVPYTRAGCDVGAFSIADMELENTSSDITSVYGNGSSQQAFTSAKGSGAPSSALKSADFEGIAIHCSRADSIDNGPGNHAGLCSAQNGGVADRLLDEPGGYSGFNGLFGAIYANQVTSQAGSFSASTQDAAGMNNGNINDLAAPVHDVYDYSSPGCKFCANGMNLAYNGVPITSKVITDTPNGNSGFPAGFDPTPAQTLGYVASMQEAGIPVTFAYIRDAHDNWSGENAFGPGEAGYVDQLKQENQAFNAFFERLAADGINKSNTLFVITADEGDHFAGGTPINAATCDGVNIPCQYNHDNAHPSANSVGEQDVELDDALAREEGNTNPFAIHFDDNPNFYVGGPAGSTAPPGPSDPAVRQLEQDMGTLTLTDQITGQVVPATEHLADAEDQTILHMTTTDPLRTPSFTVFGNPAFFYETGGGCPAGSTPGCPVVSDGFAWNHGGDEPEVTTTWLGIVGPTVRNLGETGAIWTDHTDIRPTMLALLGLPTDYEMDGRVVTQLMDSRSIPRDVGAHLGTYEALASTYKQLNAPIGEFGHYSEIASTTGSESNSDAVAQGFDRQLTACQVRRDALASAMKATLEGSFFGGASINDGQARRDIGQASQLIGEMRSLSGMSRPPTGLVCGSG
jgi:hypothetical protein